MSVELMEKYFEDCQEWMEFKELEKKAAPIEAALKPAVDRMCKMQEEVMLAGREIDEEYRAQEAKCRELGAELAPIQAEKRELVQIFVNDCWKSVASYRSRVRAIEEKKVPAEYLNRLEKYKKKLQEAMDCLEEALRMQASVMN